MQGKSSERPTKKFAGPNQNPKTNNQMQAEMLQLVRFKFLAQDLFVVEVSGAGISAGDANWWDSNNAGLPFPQLGSLIKINSKP